MYWRVVLLEIKKPQLTLAVYCQSKWSLFEAKLLTLLQMSSRTVDRNQEVNSFLNCTSWGSSPLQSQSLIWSKLLLHFKSSYVLIFTLNKGRITFLPWTGPGWEMQGVVHRLSIPRKRGVPRPPGGWILSPEKSHFSHLTQGMELLWVLFTAACCDQSIAWSIISLEGALEGIDSGLSSWKFVLPAGNSVARGWHFFSLPTHRFVTWGNCAEQFMWYLPWRDE